MELLTIAKIATPIEAPIPPSALKTPPARPYSDSGIVSVMIMLETVYNTRYMLTDETHWQVLSPNLQS